MTETMNSEYRANMIATARKNGNARCTVRANALEAGWNFMFFCPDYEVLSSPDGTKELLVFAFATGRIKGAKLVPAVGDKVLAEVRAIKAAVDTVTGWL